MKLTRKERNYIISDLFQGLDSCRFISSGELGVNDFEKAEFKDYDLSSEDEFNLCKSIILKLKEINQKKEMKC